MIELFQNASMKAWSESHSVGTLPEVKKSNLLNFPSKEWVVIC